MTVHTVVDIVGLLHIHEVGHPDTEEAVRTGAKSTLDRADAGRTSPELLVEVYAQRIGQMIAIQAAV